MFAGRYAGRFWAPILAFCLCLASYQFAAAQQQTPTLQALALLVEQRPNDPVAHDNYGVALADAGRWGESLNQLKTAVRIDANDRVCERNLASALSQSGDPASAQKIFGGLVRSDPQDTDSLLGLAEAYRNSGQDEQAVKSYQSDEPLDPMNFTLHFELAGELLKLGIFDKAQSEYEYCLCLRSSDVPSQIFLATALTEQGQTQSAEHVLQSALATVGLTSVEESQIEVQLGSLKLMEGHPADAVAALRKAITLTPSDPDIHNALGAALWANGDKRDATGEWKAAYCSNNSEAKHAAAQWLATP